MTKAVYSLQQHLITRTVLLMIIVFSVLSAGVWDYASRAADLSYNRLLNSASLSIIERISVQESQIDLDLPYAALSMLELAPDDKVYYEVIDHTGQHLTGYRKTPSPVDYQPHSDPQFFTAKYKGEVVSWVVQSKLLIAPAANGWVVIKLGQTRNARNELSGEIFFSSLATLSGILLLTTLLVWLGVRRALQPLSIISENLKNRSPNDLRPLNTPAIKEVVPLVDAINSYQQQLLHNLDTMKVFIADASHQIRSSLGGIQGQLDVTLQASDTEEIRSRLINIRQQHKKLTRLTNQLLAHALVTHRSDSIEPRLISLNALVEALLTETVRDQAHTQIDFSYTAKTDDIRIPGDKVSLKEALKNLLENAVRYGPDINQIDITLSPCDGNLVEIIIDDSGPGIPGHQRRQAIQRFSRLSSDVSGSGLGLAIVETVIQAHQGTLKLERSPSGGLRVLIRLPGAPL
ncbi:sensor histidine kinase [Amphritea sp. 2_MG-2023]|uniref:sensor histidine kinase n=1 Tax=Amphritea TaxID=515417 RepID=UPI001C06A355|nr:MULTISPECIES: sensor histidine kinase [Amphritea]MBU2966779.1 sensor histidine kinase [Amphritea atlantica]MDO6418955.1 sensor histidine kinase [Amphritea sp. 2_MG-2023]